VATGWTVRGSNPGRGEIFRTCPDWPWSPPSLLYNGYRVFPGGKERPARDADSSPPSSAVGHKRLELYLYSLYWPYGLYRAPLPGQGCTFNGFDVCRTVHRNIFLGNLNQPDAQYLKFMVFLDNNICDSDGLSVHHPKFKTVHTVPGICHTGSVAAS
jgi:hypothetical protein